MDRVIDLGRIDLMALFKKNLKTEIYYYFSTSTRIHSNLQTSYVHE